MVIKGGVGGFFLKKKFRVENNQVYRGKGGGKEEGLRLLRSSRVFWVGRSHQINSLKTGIKKKDIY